MYNPVMKLLILYHPESDHARAVDTFVRDFQRLHPDIQVDLKSLETREGAVLAKTYDATAYPAFLALEDSGAVLQFWQGKLLPQMSDVASYAF